MSLLLKKYMNGEAGIRELLVLSLPMIVSQASMSMMLFTDRYLLASLGKEYPPASMAGGFSAFMLSIFFTGLLAYINPLVAQYSGAGKRNYCLKVLIQGTLIIALVSPLIWLAGQAWIGSYFDWAGITEGQKKLAISYFSIVNAGTFFMLLNTALSSFFNRAGLPRVVMVVNLLGMLLNIPLNIHLIAHGFSGYFKEIEGAALATVLSYSSMTLVYLSYLGFSRVGTSFLKEGVSFLPDREVLLKIFRFGGPTGGEFFLLFFAFNTFVTLFQSYGPDEALAMTITFNWDIIALMPLWGLNLGIMSMVGRYMGAGKVDLALRATWSGVRVASALTLCTAFAFLVFTEPLIEVFLPVLPEETLAGIMALSTKMLRLVAFYCLATAVNMVFTATLRASGDTRWCLLISIAANWSMLGLTFLSIRVWKWSPEATWLLFVGTVVIEAMMFYMRFLSGKWKAIRVV